MRPRLIRAEDYFHLRERRQYGELIFWNNSESSSNNRYGLVVELCDCDGLFNFKRVDSYLI